MLSLFATFWPILVASSEDDGSGGLVALGIAILFAGPIFYAIVYGRYRNKGARHYHESETPAQMNNLMVYDNFVRHEKGSSSSSISGANESKVTGALNQEAKKKKKLKP